MSRRDTIIISVLVNAALLAVLFTTAITKNNTLETSKKALVEDSSQQMKDMHRIVDTTKAKEEYESNIFEKTDIQNQFTSLMEDKSEVKKDLLESKPQLNKDEEKIIYKLPEVAKETSKKSEENVFEIIVKSGDTLEKIAKTNHVKIADIYKLNNLQNSFLRVGQKLLIPKNESEQTANSQPTLKLEEKKSLDDQEYYIVKVGDNPYTIAIKHSIKPHDLLKLNNLDEKKAKRLKPGDRLRIR